MVSSLCPARLTGQEIPAETRGRDLEDIQLDERGLPRKRVGSDSAHHRKMAIYYAENITAQTNSFIFCLKDIGSKRTPVAKTIKC